MFETIAQIITSFAVVSLTGYCIYKIQTHARNAQPIMPTEQQGVISPGKGTVWFTIVVGVIAMLAGILFVIFGGLFGMVLGLFLTLMGAAFSGLMAPALSSIHDVNWNAQYVEGAAKMFGPTLGRTRTQIKWSDIASTGTTNTQYWYIQADDGRRIYWSYLYDGHGAFAQMLSQKRPDIELPL